jgi:hypothetical protein
MSAVLSQPLAPPEENYLDRRFANSNWSAAVQFKSANVGLDLARQVIFWFGAHDVGRGQNVAQLT